MALFTIIKYALAFTFAYMTYIILGPLVFDLAYENPMWNDMPIEMTAFRDLEYGIWILFAILIIAVLLISGISEANRKKNLEA